MSQPRTTSSLLTGGESLGLPTSPAHDEARPSNPDIEAGTLQHGAVHAAAEGAKPSTPDSPEGEEERIRDRSKRSHPIAYWSTWLPVFILIVARGSDVRACLIFGVAW